MPPSEDRSRVDIITRHSRTHRSPHVDDNGPQHAYGIAARIEQVAENSVRLNQGTLYPALVRLEQKGWIKGDWQKTENNREARYYSITRSGARALGQQSEWWQRSADLVNRLLTDKA